MSALAISGIVLACVFASALFGLILQRPLPDHHLTSESKDAVKLGTGLIATLAALVLGLMIASAKNAHDTARSEVNDLAAGLVLLDRVLAHYGAPEAEEARGLLRRRASLAVERVWHTTLSEPEDVARDWEAAADAFFDKIQDLHPKNDTQQALHSQMMQINTDLAKTRFLLTENNAGSIPLPFMVVLVSWVSIIFAIFGLVAPRNATVIAVLFLCALSVSGAVFLILELDQPFDGIVQVSSAPLQDAVARIGR